jgi:hypothetical protein
MVAGNEHDGPDNGRDTDTYRDRWIECTSDEIRIRGYYFPWGSKRIRYRDIRGVRIVTLGVLRGRARIWGTASPRYWANLDPARPGKSSGLVLDLGGAVRPLLTPDNTKAVLACIRAHSAATVTGPTSAPIV